MKRIIVALAMVAASVFVASPALAEGATTDTTTLQAPADQAPADQAAVDQAAAKAAEEAAAAEVAAKAAEDQAAAAKAAEDQAAAAAAAKAAEDQAAAAKAAEDQAAAAAAAEAAAAQGSKGPAAKSVTIAQGNDNPPQHVKVNVCHATRSDSNPYVLLSVDDDSTKFQGHLEHRNHPDKTWKSAGTFNDVAHVAGQAKPDIIGDYPGHVLDGVVTAATCNGESTDTQIEPVAPTVRQSSKCDVAGFVDLPQDLYYQEEELIIHYSFVKGSAAMTAGSYDVLAEIKANGYAFADGELEFHFTGTLQAAAHCPTIKNDAVADVVTSQNCDGGDVPHTTTVEGVTYKFTKGDGVSGAWEITAKAKDGFTLTGKTVFTGNAGNPDNCGKVNPVSDGRVVPDAGVAPNAGVLPDTGGSPLGLLAISGLLIVGGATLIGRRRTI